MSPYIYAVTIIIVMLPYSVISEDKIDAGKLFAELFSEPEIVADELAIGAPPEVEAIAKKMKVAMAANPEKIAALVKARKPGEPLTYQSWFGITEKEFQMMLDKDNLKVRKIGTRRLAVRNVDSKFYSSYSSDAPALSDFAYTVDTGVFRYKGVEIPRIKDIHADEETVLGKWDGIRWYRESGQVGQSNQMIFEFNIGRIDGGKRGLIRLHIRKAGEPRREQILVFDIPTAD